jgi:crotonobetainyl-CoA:carnitine CoA-transferase CaiB-like acyl-CoA transferase
MAEERGNAPVGALAGVRVLDLTEGFAGALATMVLADNGAAVVRVVPPADERHDPADALAGARQWHRSKDVRCLDVRAADGSRELKKLVREADVIVESDGAWVVEHGSIEWPDPATGSIRCVIDAVGDQPGLTGVPAHSTVVHAISGRMVDYGRTFKRDRPVYVAPRLAEFAAGMAAVHGIGAALLERSRTQRGQLVRTSLLRALTAFDFFGPAGITAVPPSAANPLGPTPALGYIPARTKDGRWLQWANFAPHLLREELAVLGLDDLLAEPGFAQLPAASPADAHGLWERVLTATGERTADEWMAILTERGVAGGDIVVHTREGMDHPQARHNGDVIHVDDPEVGPSEQIGPIARFSATPSAVGATPWASVERTSPAAAVASSSLDRRPPLDGMLVLEAATMIATPWSTAVLADLGARVVKIEPLGGEAGRSLPFLKMLQGKESLCVDIKSAEGREIVHRFAARADEFVQNYRPGVPEKLGIDAVTLRALNDRLVYVYAGAYGSDGPYVRMPGYHPTAGAIAGAAALQAGDPQFDPSTLEGLKAESLHRFWANEGHPDPVTGMVVAAAILLGLVARDRSTEGQEITMSMLAANAYLMSDDWIRYAGAPDRPRVDGELLGTGPLDRLYATRDGWVAVCAPTAGEWERLCGVLGAEALFSDARFTDETTRARNGVALSEALSTLIAERDADELEAASVRAGVGCVRADRGGFADWQRGEIEAGRTALAAHVHSTQAGEHWRAAAIVEMEGLANPGGASTAGQQTRAILAELGYSPTEVDDLVERSIVSES